MRTLSVAGITVAILLALVAAVNAQDGPSLGDVARQQRLEREKDKHSPKKVITNDEIPSRPAANEENDNGESSSESTPALKREETAQHWKQVIQQAKEVIAENEKRLERFKASIHFVEANRYGNGVQYNQEQLRRQQEAERAQKQLEEEKRKLTDMQEAARRQGFGSAVYDP